MKKDKISVIIDTNLWISFLITNDFSKLDEVLFSRKIILIFSEELRDEFLAVVGRPKFKRYFSSSNIKKVLKVIDEYAEIVLVKSNEDACRDFKDNFLLSLAVDGKADYLLTGDNDLLALNPFKDTHIVTFSAFLEKIK